MDTPKQQLKRRWDPWPVSIIAFFTVAILGCVGFIAFCSMHGTELVAKDYYEREIRFQSEMERVRRTQTLDAGASVDYDATANCIVVSIPPSHAKDLTAARLSLSRPSSASLDMQMKFEPDALGCQRVSAADLATGPWRVKVTWTARNQEYQLDRPIVVGPAPAPLTK